MSRITSIIFIVWKTCQIFQNLKLHQMSKKIIKFNFPSVYSVSMRETELNWNWINRWKISFIDLFVHLAELEVLKYLASFPYWSSFESFWLHRIESWKRLLDLPLSKVYYYGLCYVDIPWLPYCSTGSKTVSLSHWTANISNRSSWRMVQSFYKLMRPPTLTPANIPVSLRMQMERILLLLLCLYWVSSVLCGVVAAWIHWEKFWG